MMIDFDTMSKFVQFVAALVTIAKFVMEVSQPGHKRGQLSDYSLKLLCKLESGKSPRGCSSYL